MKVRCIDARASAGILVAGREYKVIRTDTICPDDPNERYDLQELNGDHIGEWRTSRFEVVKEKKSMSIYHDSKETAQAAALNLSAQIDAALSPLHSVEEALLKPVMERWLPIAKKDFPQLAEQYEEGSITSKELLNGLWEEFSRLSKGEQ
jgi:hypothetical protein